MTSKVAEVQYLTALLEGQVVTVGMNEVQMIKYGEGADYIAALEVNGSSIVAIVSKKAAIIANISPRPLRWEESENDAVLSGCHSTNQMIRMIQTYLNNEPLFKRNETFGVIVSGFYADEIALPDALDSIRGALTPWRFPVKEITYEVRESTHERGIGDTTIIVDGRVTDPVVWVDDEIITG